MRLVLAFVSVALWAAVGCGGPDACTANCPDGTACSTGDTCASFFCSAQGKCAPLDCSATTASYQTIHDEVFAPSCAKFSVCHNASYHAAKMDLETDAYAALVGVAPTNAAASAMGMKRVDPGNEANSFLAMKLTMPAYSMTFGDIMPAGQRLDAQHIDEIRCWIRQGAPKN